MVLYILYYFFLQWIKYFSDEHLGTSNLSLVIKYRNTNYNKCFLDIYSLY